jgi:hypothetical protein
LPQPLKVEMNTPILNRAGVLLVGNLNLNFRLFEVKGVLFIGMGNEPSEGEALYQD